MYESRVLSGMRPTGALHLGHYHGALKNWVDLQTKHPCYFFVADWHALTTHYAESQVIASSTTEMLIDWLACGVDPKQSTLFIQSRIPQHAELMVLLSMMTPLSWLERVPTYKDQQTKLADKDLSTYGFLGYPLLQSADVLIYRANQVPVGEDQVPHIEMTREIARRFNSLFGKESDFEAKVKAAIKNFGSENAQKYLELRTLFQEEGDVKALENAKHLVAAAPNLEKVNKERLLAYLEGGHKLILVEPQAMLTRASRLPGLDGQKMSKSYCNTIALRDAPDTVRKKIKTMPTDPARVRRNDSGSPERCPVWQFHRVYSSTETKSWVQQGCTNATIGCLECKQPVIDAVLNEQEPMFERAQKYLDEPSLLKAIIDDGCDRATIVAEETMRDVRAAMGLKKWD